jgi:hypothetical protein
MDNFFDWSDEAVAPLNPPRDKLAESIAADVQAFLDAGGEIEKVPYDPIPEMVGGVATIKRKWPAEEGVTRATPTE